MPMPLPVGVAVMLSRYLIRALGNHVRALGNLIRALGNPIRRLPVLPDAMLPDAFRCTPTGEQGPVLILTTPSAP